MPGALTLLAQLAITVAAPDTVALRGTVDVTVHVTARSSVAPAVSPPAFRPFVLLRSTVAQRVESDAQGPRAVADYRYTLAATREGTFTIAPFVARSGREFARSDALTLVVRADSAARTRLPAIVAGARLEHVPPVSFRAIAHPDTVYVGAQATYELGVFLDGTVRDRVRRMEAVAPDMRGVLAYDPPMPLEVFDAQSSKGRRYEAHVYRRAVFPLSPGRIAIPPARLTYALPLSYSFFSREESYELTSDSVVIVAREPPPESRPADYTGAVGQLQLAARLDSAAPRVGDPVSLRVTVSGTGNVKLWPRPDLRVDWGTVIDGEERVSLDRDPVVVRGSKQFEWLITPQTAGTLVLPPVRYPYFDPDAREYRIAQTAPETLTVAPGALAVVEAAEDTMSRLPVRAVYRGVLPRPLHTRRPLWLLLALAPLPAGVLVVARRAPRARTGRAAAVTLRQLARERSAVSPREVRRVLVRSIAERLGVAPGALAGRAAVMRTARRAGVSAATAAQLDAVLAALDEASYAPAGRNRRDAPRVAYIVYRAIDREARPLRRRSAPASALVLLLVAVVGTPLLALPQERGPAAEFARGVALYERGMYKAALVAFEAAATQESRAPDPWANAGTAAWAVRDTARAALGWQRALRLEPLAPDVRERLPLIGPAADAPLAAVPPVPPGALILLGGVIWLALWMHAAVRVARHGRTSAALTTAAAVAALLLAGAGAALDARLAARDLAVVRAGTALRVLPMLAADSSTTVRTGEVARVVARRGDWARVATDRARDGWMPAALLLPLARD